MKCETHHWNPSMIRGLVADLPCPYPDCENGPGDARDFWYTVDREPMRLLRDDELPTDRSTRRQWIRVQWRDAAKVGPRGWSWIERGKPRPEDTLEYLYADG